MTAPCLVARKVGFLVEALESFVYSEAANLDSAIISATRVTNGAGGQRSTPGGITYASSVKWIFLLSLEIVIRSDAISTALDVQMCDACLSRTIVEIVICAKIVLRTSLQLPSIFSLRKMTVCLTQTLILKEVVRELRRPALFAYPGHQVPAHYRVLKAVCYIRRSTTVSDP